MARRSRPWFFTRDRCWVTIINGDRIPLATEAEGEQKAWEVFYAKMAEAKKESRRPPSITAARLFDHFLEFVRRDQAPLTYETHSRHLNKFVDHVGKEVAVDELRPFHVNRWLAGKTWASTTQCGAVTSLKCALSWGKREGYIDRNPLEDMRRPTPGRRMSIMTEEQYRQVFEARTDDRIGELMIALHETGARPSEVMNLQASMIDFEKGRAVLNSKTSKKTGLKRTILLNRTVLELCARLAEQYPAGQLFRNAHGTPWTRNSICRRFGRLRRKLGFGPEVTAESFRHMFATDCLMQGIPIATVALLLGHSSTAMVSRNYSHLDERQEHLMAALKEVRPDPSGCA
jgi:integrase